jgi:hypothetical protein
VSTKLGSAIESCASVTLKQAQGEPTAARIPSAHKQGIVEACVPRTFKFLTGTRFMELWELHAFFDGQTWKTHTVEEYIALLPYTYA